MDPHAHAHDAHDFDWDAMVAFTELEGEVLMPFLDEAMSALAGVASQDGIEVRRILDVGCGPGVATCRLAQRFEGSTVVGADGSTEMLANVAARADRLGVIDRVETMVVDLPDGIEELGPADLVWASMVLHHVGDEAAALRALRGRLDPGRLLALVEFGDEPLRLLPDDAGLGGPETWQRLDAARDTWMAEMRAGLAGAVPSAPYPQMLAAAGFEVVIDRTVSIRLGAPLDHRARQFAVAYLTRMRQHVAPYAADADMAVLDRLLDEGDAGGVLHRPDASLNISRRLFVARAM